jgi:hypothetical protein
MWAMCGYVRFLRGTAWYEECRRHSETCGLPFGVGAGVSLTLLVTLLVTIIARTFI